MAVTTLAENWKTLGPIRSLANLLTLGFTLIDQFNSVKIQSFYFFNSLSDNINNTNLDITRIQYFLKNKAIHYNCGYWFCLMLLRWWWTHAGVEPGPSWCELMQYQFAILTPYFHHLSDMIVLVRIDCCAEITLTIIH